MAASYQINDLERLTGIKAHTIRIWEKRYNLIEPRRTQTNIRFYDDEQARKLLNVATLLEHGLKISKIAALSAKELNQRLIDLQLTSDDDAVTRVFINDLTSSMLIYNEAGFEKTLSAAITRFGIYECMIRVINPFLSKVGMMWAINESLPAQEHFASCLIRRKLCSACDGLPDPSRSDKKFLLFLPPAEWHDLGLIFSEYLIRSKGYPVICLGQNVPYDNLSQVISATSPTHILGLFITGRPVNEVNEFVRNISHKHGKIHLLLGGPVVMQGKAFSQPHVTRLPSPAALLELL